MWNSYQHSAFVVVIVHGPDDITRTTWPDASEVKRYTRSLLEQGVPTGNIRIYRTRLVRPPTPPY